MRYNPSYIFCRPILSEEQRKYIHDLAVSYPLTEFKRDSRNLEEASIDFIYTSAQIEGNTYDRVDTSILLRMGITAGGKRYSDAVMIINLRDAFNMVMHCDANTEINHNYLCDLHQELTKNGLLLPKEQGIMRTKHVKISGTDYTPLDDPIRLREEMKFTLLEANKYDDPFERAIYFHCNIAYLQYFSDGNKRLARMVQTAVLTQHNLMPLIFDIKFSQQYIKAVIAYYESGDYQPYVDFFQKNYELSIKRMHGMSFEDMFGEDAAQIMLTRAKEIFSMPVESETAKIFRVLSLEVMEEYYQDASKINWFDIELQTAYLAISEHGENPDEILSLLYKYSPGTVTEEKQKILEEEVQRIAANKALYDTPQVRQSQD